MFTINIFVISKRTNLKADRINIITKNCVYSNKMLLKQIRHIQIVQCLNTLRYMPLKQALKQFENFLNWKNNLTLAIHFINDSNSIIITKITIL